MPSDEKINEYFPHVTQQLSPLCLIYVTALLYPNLWEKFPDIIIPITIIHSILLRINIK